MIDEPQTPTEMETYLKYLEVRINKLKSNRNQVNPFEQSNLYSSISDKLDELEFIYELFTKKVVNNELSESIIMREINSAN